MGDEKSYNVIDAFLYGCIGRPISEEIYSRDHGKSAIVTNRGFVVVSSEADPDTFSIEELVNDSLTCSDIVRNQDGSVAYDFRHNDVNDLTFRIDVMPLRYLDEDFGAFVVQSLSRDAPYTILGVEFNRDPLNEEEAEVMESMPLGILR